MQFTDEVIQRFLKGGCTAKEARLIYEYLAANPDVLNQYLTQTEWDNISVEYESPGELFFEEQWLKIKHRNQRYSNKRFFWAAAAAVLICISASVFFYERFADPELTKNTVRQLTISNNKNNPVIFYLPDSTKVVLDVGGHVTYNASFHQKKRDIYLKGAATFYVARDTSRPFTVFSGPLATTALGTEFEVSNRKSGEIVVRLNEGSILVQSIDSTTKQSFKHKLKKGEVLTYDEATGKAAIKKASRQINAKVTPVRPASKAIKAPNSSVRDSVSLDFQRIPLTTVFKTLEKAFNVQFIVNKRITDNISFTARFTEDQSLETIVSIIGRSNNIRIVKTGATQYSVN